MSRQAVRGLSPAPGSFDVPLSAFNNTLTPLETVIVYLKDNYLLNYKTIGDMTGRDQRGIGIAYRRAKKKGNVSPGYAKISFDPETLKDRTLSPAEHLVSFLAYERKLTKAEIGRQLGKDQRTIWTMSVRLAPQRMTSPAPRSGASYNLVSMSLRLVEPAKSCKSGS